MYNVLMDATKTTKRLEQMTRKMTRKLRAMRAAEIGRAHV